MQLKLTEMERIFRKLKMQVKDTHHKNAYFYYEGKLIFKTRISQGKGEIAKPVIEQIINQFHLKKGQFVALKNCPLSYEDYVTILKEKSLIS